MNDTLDSIRLSKASELSYLNGRDPSILTYGQRFCPSTETRKNLLSSYDLEECDSIDRSGSSTSQTAQTLKVYLRVKPFPKKAKVTEKQTEAYQIVNPTTLCTKLPALDGKNQEAGNIVCKKFTFTRIFGPEATQEEIFEQTVRPQMAEFLSGQDGTIMTYGTTSSGKSYTLQGTAASPGIIPRALEFVFSNIAPKSTPCYRPVHYCDVANLDAAERAQELESKGKLLTFTVSDRHHYTNAYKQMQKLLKEESTVGQSEHSDAWYSVWVSFAEIYNETVYDLLSADCRRRRTPLKLATDNRGRTFIKDLKTVCVNSGLEAYLVLMAGQDNLKVAATALNAKSSRSHCVFMIKLLKYYSENDPNSVDVSTFTFCDLAGAERLKKTLNIGERLKEAQNINTSLLVLGRCLKSIREGQLTKQKTEIAGPFRESKLTRLFQWALCGKEHISLIVNISPVPNLYGETLNVLHFSAIAKKIVIERKKQTKKKRKSRFSMIVAQTIKTTTDWDVTQLDVSHEDLEDIDEEESKFVHLEDYQTVVAENEKLKKEIAAFKSSALTRDFEIRQEMANTYIGMMKKLEAECKNRLKHMQEQQNDILEWSIKQMEDFYTQKIEKLTNRNRRRKSNEKEEETRESIEELEKKNSHLTCKIITLQNALQDLRNLNQSLDDERNKAVFELRLTKEELKSVQSLLESVQKELGYDEASTLYVDKLKTQLSERQEQIKKLKEFLNEAKEEYIAITKNLREKEYRLNKQAETIANNEDKIDDLEQQIEYGNICLNERAKSIETLEKRLEQQSQAISDRDSQIRRMKQQINELEKEKATLHDKNVYNSGTVERKTEQNEMEEQILSYSSQCKESEESVVQEKVCSDIEEVELDETADSNRSQAEKDCQLNSSNYSESTGSEDEVYSETSVEESIEECSNESVEII